MFLGWRDALIAYSVAAGLFQPGI